MIIVTIGEREQIEKIWKKNPLFSTYRIPFVPLKDGNWGVEEYTYSHEVFKGVKGIIERGASGLREVRLVDRHDTKMYDDD